MNTSVWNRHSVLFAAVVALSCGCVIVESSDTEGTTTQVVTGPQDTTMGDPVTDTSASGSTETSGETTVDETSTDASTSDMGSSGTTTTGNSDPDTTMPDSTSGSTDDSTTGEDPSTGEDTDTDPFETTDGETTDPTETTGSSSTSGGNDSSSTGDNTTGAPSGACNDYGDAIADCYDEGEGQDARDFCHAELDYLGVEYGPECVEAQEQWYDCLSQLPCDLIDADNVCTAEHNYADLKCK